jgi:hypothetical protein
MDSQRKYLHEPDIREGEMVPDFVAAVYRGLQNGKHPGFMRRTGHRLCLRKPAIGRLRNPRHLAARILWHTVRVPPPGPAFTLDTKLKYQSGWPDRAGKMTR